MFKNWKAEISIILVLFLLAFICLVIYEIFKDSFTSLPSNKKQTTFVLNHAKAINADSVAVFVKGQYFHLEKSDEKWIQTFPAKNVKAQSPVKIIIHKGENENRVKVPDLECKNCEGKHVFLGKKGKLTYRFVAID